MGQCKPQRTDNLFLLYAQNPEIRQIVCDLNPYLAVGQQCFHQLVHRLWLCLFWLLGTDLADVIGFLEEKTEKPAKSKKSPER